nr:uncharacterized protein CI109_005068 [Kwoniella shandongensis]KAA5526496.1 hypothetical protein CI109_005068 [Kwoniella shandongensis]
MEHLQEMSARMDRFERLIESLVHAIPGQPQAPAQPPAPVLPPPSPPPPPPVQVQHASSTLDPRVDLSPINGADTLHTISPQATQSATRTTHEVRHSAHTPSASPVDRMTSNLRDLGEGNVSERFQKRVEEAAGALVQFGPTSFWTHKNSRPHSNIVPFAYDRRPGDRVEWSRNLPPSLHISRSAHDQALEYFGAYYAPWCFNVDMPAFLNDLTLCNLVSATDDDRPTPPTRTASYSPLLHCCVMFLGMTLIRDEHPSLMKSLELVFMQHCSSLLPVECDHTTLSSLRAYNLFANCAHAIRIPPTERSPSPGDRQSTSGYLYSAMAIGGVHALGLNVNCDSYVAKGHITDKERNLRDSAYWTVFIQDALRAIAAGRQPLLLQSDIPYPAINHDVDNTPWLAPPMLSSSIFASRPGVTTNGWKSMRSTSFHWAARLAVLGCTVLETLYSPRGNGTRTEEAAVHLSQQLESWYHQFPLSPPEASPLPHVLLLHMTYNLLMIFVHRPFYRSSEHDSDQKCDRAAKSILNLLQLFDNTHGIRFAHHNIINVIFGAATIFLLRYVGTGSDEAAQNIDLQCYNQCVDFMAAAGLSWVEAGVARDVLLSLQTEYDSGIGNSQQAVQPPFSPGPFVNDFPDWLTSVDMWSSMFPDSTGQWNTVTDV